jgi:hypothetical protein
MSKKGPPKISAVIGRRSPGAKSKKIKQGEDEGE